MSLVGGCSGGVVRSWQSLWQQQRWYCLCHGRIHGTRISDFVFMDYATVAVGVTGTAMLLFGAGDWGKGIAC
jgi:hypothetical protein